MALPERVRQIAVTTIDNYCKERCPEDISDVIRLNYEVNANHIRIYEARKTADNADQWTQKPVALFQYDKRQSCWTLHSIARNNKWRIHDDENSSSNLEDLLAAVDADVTGTFWRE